MTVNHWVAGSNPARGAFFIMKHFSYLFSLILSIFLSACDPVSVAVLSGCAGGAGYYAFQSNKSGGYKQAKRNDKIKKSILQIWKINELDEPFLKLYVFNGQAFIIGAATSPDSLKKAFLLAKKKEPNTINLANLKIGNWNKKLQSSIRKKMLLKSSVSSFNYNVKSIGGFVWVVGVAATESEKEAVLKIAKNKSDNVIHGIIVNKEQSLQKQDLDEEDDEDLIQHSKS